MNDLRCPNCHSYRVQARYPEIHCYACGYSDSLVDFPISHDVHRFYSVDAGRGDPGPCLPDAAPVPVPEMPVRPNAFAELKGQLNYLQNRLNEHLDKPAVEKPKAPTETPRGRIKI